MIKNRVIARIRTARKAFDVIFQLSACQPLKLNTSKTANNKIKGMVTSSNKASITSFRRIFLKEIKIKAAK
jgi:hypothetical protein